METFEKTLEVTKEDLDDLNHVNNVRYVQWIQDISKEHWVTNAPEEMRKEVIWVVRQHIITYKNAAKLGDIVFLKTHIAKAEGPISTRVVQMFDSQKNTLLVESKTDWCLLNATSLRPMRISEEIKNVFAP